MSAFARALYSHPFVRVVRAITMSFRLALMKGSKPMLALATLGMSAYGTYEWNKTKSSLHLHAGMSVKDMDAIFKEIDTDKSGFITEEELLKYLQDKKIQGIGKYEAHAMVVAADETKDGKISYTEWQDLIKGTHNASHPGDKMAPHPTAPGVPKSKVDTHVINGIKEEK